jgi:hypothetical protein
LNFLVAEESRFPQDSLFLNRRLKCMGRDSATATFCRKPWINFIDRAWFLSISKAIRPRDHHTHQRASVQGTLSMKMLDSRLGAFPMIWLAFCQSANAQLVTKLSEAIRQFKQIHAEVSDITLQRDAAAVLAAAPIVRGRLAGGSFTDSDIDEALIGSWRKLRL